MQEIRLFLVDDEKHVREGLRMRLEMEPGFHVIGEAADGLTALAAVPAANPDVVLMDIQMPGGDGISTTQRLRAAAETCGIVIVSMQDDAATRARAAAAGADAFVGKHEIDTALTDAIRSAAGRRRTSQHADRPA